MQILLFSFLRHILTNFKYWSFRTVFKKLFDHILCDKSLFENIKYFNVLKVIFLFDG